LVETIVSLLWCLSNPINTTDLLFPFEDDRTCFAIVGELCGCVDNRKKSHGDDRGGFQGITQVTILSHKIPRGTTNEVEVPLERIGTRSGRVHF
jgi:hypothetical protein